MDRVPASRFVANFLNRFDIAAVVAAVIEEGFPPIPETRDFPAFPLPCY